MGKRKATPPPLRSGTREERGIETYHIKVRIRVELADWLQRTTVRSGRSMNAELNEVLAFAKAKGFGK